MDIAFHIRHGTSLTPRHLSWYVAKKEVSHQLLSGPVLEELGLKTGEALMSPFEKHSGDVDMRDLIVEPCFKKGTVAHMRNDDGLYQAPGLTDYYPFYNGVPLLNLSINTKEEMDEALGTLV